MPIVRPVYPNELYHYGIKGMHWGVRRYQPYPKGYKGSGKYLGKRSRVRGTQKSNGVKKLTDEQKKWLIRNGTPNDLNKYANQLTPQQLREAITRVKTEYDLKDLRTERPRRILKNVAETIGNAGKILKGGTQFYEFGIARSNAKALKNAEMLNNNGYSLAPGTTYSDLIRKTNGDASTPIPSEWAGLSRGRIRGSRQKKRRR